MERSSIVRKASNEASVEVGEPQEGLDFLLGLRGWPFCDAGDFHGIHLNVVVRDDNAEILDLLLFKLTVRGTQERLERE
jgi:hypothetical protein